MFTPEYLKSRAFTRNWEGGFVNNPKDPGGATNKGITQVTYDSYRIKHNLSTQSVEHMSEAEANEIYFTYFLAARCDLLAWPLCLVVFDTAINFGVRKSILFLQEALGVNRDGILGPMSKRALDTASPEETATKMCDIRIAYRHYRVSVAPSQKIFLKGWLRRDNALKDQIGAKT